MTDAPTFTVLAPIHRPPDLLPFAIRSVLDQTRSDFELFIICDGAPEATAEAARAFAAQDRRIRAFVHPKGDAAFPVGGEGVLIELVQAPPEVVRAFAAMAQSAGA